MTETSPSSSENKKPLLLAYALGIFGVTAFGATLPVTHIALLDFSPEFLTFARALIASVMAVVAMLVFKKPLRHKNDIQILLAGVFLIFTFPGFMSVAMESVPAAYGGVVLGFLPLTTAILARLITEEKPSLRFWLLSMAGCAIVITFIIVKADTNQDTGNISGYAWLVLAGLTASLGYVIFGKLSRTTPGWEIISRSLILNFPLTLIGLIWFSDTSIFQASTSGAVALLYLGSFSMFLAFCGWNVALALGGIARIGQLQLLQVFVTIVVATLLLEETIDTMTIITAALITAIIAISRKA